MPRQRAARLPLEISSLDGEGRGLAEHEGVTWHVAGALPGDRALVELGHRSPHKAEAWARLVTLERPGASRVAPSCPATGRCGGCPIGALAYPAQLAWKAERLASLVRTLPGAPEPRPIVAAPRPLGYRNHARLVYATNRERPRLGAYAPHTHEVVDLSGCRVVEAVLEEVRAAILARLTAERVSAYDEATKAGALAYVALRSNHAGAVHVTLVGPDLAALAPLASLRDAHSAIAGVSLNLRPSGNAIFGRETRTIAGEAELEERVGAVQLSLSPTAFFQVNREVAALIYADVVRAFAPGGGHIVDVYSGVGGIALALARAGCTDVHGVEVNADAVRDATRAAARLAHAPRFVAADAATGLLGVTAAGAVRGLVVNPPRRGLDDATIAAVAQAAPTQLAYVSCDPETLVRDLRALGTSGLQVRSIGAYDMHPQTAHIETLAILARA